MSQVNVTLSFASAAEAAAALAKLGNVSNAAPTANTSRTAEAGKADAPESKGKNSDKAENKPAKEEKKAVTIDAADFKSKLIDGALMPYSKKVDKDTFGKTMAKFGVKNVKDIEAKPEIWSDLYAHCQEALNG
jgi:hypothetical protein